MGAGARPVRSSASASMDAWKWGAGAAHDRAGPGEQGADVRGDFVGGTLPHGRWKEDLAGPKSRHQGVVPAIKISRVRSMRAQIRDAPRAARTFVSPTPLGCVPLR